jgi:hypothetical protein
LNHLTIKVPIWKSKSIGIADRLLNDDVEVKISYRKKDGELLYPATYFIKKELVKKFPIQVISGIKLHIVPIHKLTVIK